uniref:Acyl-CoA-binding domain-containing protein 6 n=1 Tax=Electrophorus electricus TaxID=8005 RepID=A0AAY5EHE3_ELEEL
MASRSPSSSPDSATGSGTDPARPDTGEALGGGSDSDSDLGLDQFDCGAADSGLRLDGPGLESEFEAAADRVRDLVQIASREQLLYLYARYKQVAKVGKCNTAKPGFFDFEGQRKWTAWKQLGETSREQAMQEYVTCVHALDPDGHTKCSSERRGGERRIGFSGAAVSCLYQEETIRRIRNIFDYCRENNIDQVSKALSSMNVDVNTKDEEGRALLHWACDRGHTELVTLLLHHNADINSQDDEGQTPLHYASACEFAEIVEVLLKAGADPSIKDGEGSLPEEVTESSSISSLLRQYSAPKG